MNIWQKLIQIFSNGTGGVVGKAVTATTIGAALIPAFVWITGHQNDVAACVTWGNLFLLGVIFAPIILIIYLTRPGSPGNRM